MHFTSISLTAVLLIVQLSKSVLCQHLATQRVETNVTKWNNNRHHRMQTDDMSKTCNDLIKNLHDRVGVLATLDEDLRGRLENIERKINQFETRVIGHMDSMAVQQTDILKRLDALDYMERQTKRNVDELKSDLNHVREKDISLRTARQADRLPSMFTTDSKLDSLGTLLLSTRSAINELNIHLEANISKLSKRLKNNRRQSHRDSPNFNVNQPSNEPLITSCAQGQPTNNGILRLQLTSESEPFYVHCDEESVGGGWTIIQSRYNGNINFYRDWLEYQAGFGNLAGEFFIGLEKLHALTSSAVHELLIMLQDFDGRRTYAHYNLFAIGSEKEDYALNLLGDYDGNAGDSLSYHAGWKFSTFDNDNDGCLNCNCAQSHNGAWWYNWCDMSNLNGKYFTENYNNTPLYEGMYWSGFGGPSYSLKAVRMMIRPLNAEDDSQR